MDSIWPHNASPLFPLPRLNIDVLLLHEVHNANGDGRFRNDRFKANTKMDKTKDKKGGILICYVKHENHKMILAFGKCVMNLLKDLQYKRYVPIRNLCKKRKHWNYFFNRFSGAIMSIYWYMKCNENNKLSKGRKFSNASHIDLLLLLALRSLFQIISHSTWTYKLMDYLLQYN